MNDPDAELRPSPFPAAVVAIVLMLADIAVHWPGTLVPDSKNQLRQAIAGSFTDWHPPIMAELWSVLGSKVPAMLVLQVALYWLGFWALSETLRRRGSGRWSWLMLAAGLTPIGLNYTGIIGKDDLLASFFIAAFGVAALTRRYWLAAPLGIFGMLCRANGVFALPPLFVANRRGSKPLVIALSVIAAAILVPLSSFINHDILRARPTGVERSLQLFDLAGIAHFSGDSSVLPAGMERAEQCYTPVLWDTLWLERTRAGGHPGFACAVAFSNLPPSLTGSWLKGIARHPIAYLRHRVAHFNSTTFFFVPPMEQCVAAAALHTCDFSKRGLLIDFIEKNALLWPVTWLAVGLVMLFQRRDAVSEALTLSALLYGFAYLVVGVASDFRYFYWTELAVQAAWMFDVAAERRVSQWKPLAIAIALVWVIGYAARFAML